MIVCETLSLWPPFKPWNCGCRISRKRRRFRFGQNSWSKWYGSVITEVDIHAHERPGSTGVSKSQRKINVRGDNQSGTLMTLKNFAGFYYVSLFLGLISSCCSGKWALTHCPPPHTPNPLLWKSYLGRIKDRTWKTAEIEPSMATVLMIISLDGDVQFIVGLVSFIINYLCCLRKGVTDWLEWSIFYGERGLLQACCKLHPVVVITLLWIGKSFKITVLHECVGACTFAHCNPILEYCSLYTALSTLDNSLFYHSQVNAKDVNRFQLVSPTCLNLHFL